MEKVDYEEMSPYGQFHCANIGYQWLETATGIMIDKGIMFAKFGEYATILKALTNNNFNGYLRQEKPDYKNGILTEKDEKKWDEKMRQRKYYESRKKNQLSVNLL